MSSKNGTQMTEALQVILRVSAQYWTTWMGRKGFQMGSNIAMVDGFRVFVLLVACDTYMESEIEKTTNLIKKLSKIAKTSLQNAYSWYRKTFQNKLSFLTRTVPQAYKKMDKIEKN